LFDSKADFAKHPDFVKLIHEDTDINDGVFNKILKAEDLVVFNAEEWYNSPQPPTYTNAAQAVGLKVMIGMAIRRGDENIGILTYRPIKDSKFIFQLPLFKSIISQIAISIANIIANEEIKSRQEEKSKLLEFSNALASERDKFTVALILKQQLQELFSIEEYVVCILNEDKKTYTPLLYNPHAEFASHPDFIKLLHHPADVNDGVHDKILSAEDPVTFKVEDILKMKSPPAYKNTIADMGLKIFTGMRIRLGHEDIGVLTFRHDDFQLIPNKKQLFKSICSQIAITVSNITANEKIITQLKEIDQYKQQLEVEKIYLKEEIETSQNFNEMIGDSLEMKKVFRLVSQVASSESTVLILGETGTGKELIARAIHNSSPRKNKLLVKLNCAALPANLIESELFGHERGSFTGAIERRIGKFELANGGSLFLDEIGEMPLELQVKLLRVLQEKEIERVGGKNTIKIDVRIISATNRTLENLLNEGKFRRDLFYRLNIFPINVPPLKKRREDIPLLAAHFINRYSKKSGRRINGLSKKALDELMQYDWPGNIRELEHLIERSILLASGEIINEIHLPSGNKYQSVPNSPEEWDLRTIDDNEKDHILKILKHVNGRVSGEGGAAEILGVPPSTLNSKMKRLGIRKEHFG
jgi:transcriptional regulator with GAF, ATPase, and Fis domain